MKKTIIINGRVYLFKSDYVGHTDFDFTEDLLRSTNSEGVTVDKQFSALDQLKASRYANVQITFTGEAKRGAQ